MLPSGGQGAVNALQDAVILTNCLYDLKDLTQGSIEEALQDFREQRYEQVKIQTDNSNQAQFVYNGQVKQERIRMLFLLFVFVFAFVSTVINSGDVSCCRLWLKEP